MKKHFAKGFNFDGSIDGQRLPWTKACVRFAFHDGKSRVFFEYECGLEITEQPLDGKRRVLLRLERYASPGKVHEVTVEQRDEKGVVVGSWQGVDAKLVEYSVAWDNGASAVTPERLVFEVSYNKVKTG